MKLKPIAYTVASLTFLGGAAWLLGLKKFSDSLQVITDTSFEVTGRFLGVPTSFDLIVKPTIKNPTKTALTMSQPYVEMRLSENGSPLATSQVSDKNFTIAALSQIPFDPIRLPISLASSITDILDFAKTALKTKKIQVFIKVVTVINKDSIFPIRVEQPTVKELKF